MLVLIADKFPEHGRAALRSLGLDVESRPTLGADDLPDAVRETGAGVLVVRSTRVTAACIEAGAELQLVVRAGAGVNTIDLDAAAKRGVFVANCPGKNAIAVAELAMGLMAAVDRNIVDAAAELRAGKWNKKRYGKARGLFGRTLGLVGFGNIAREVASRARAFGLEVRAWSRSLDDDVAKAHDVTRSPSLRDLLSTSDIVSVHVPKGPDASPLMGAEELALMPQGAVLIHTARGGVVDDTALAEAVRAGRIRAGVDVYEGEPGSGEAPFESPLRDVPGLVGTPHIGASTSQAESAIAEEVVRIVESYVRRGAVPNTVNVVRDRPAHFTVVVRHLDRVGVLAKILDALREDQLNVKEMRNVIFTGDEGAACATISLEREPSATLLGGLRSQPNILAVEVRAV